MNGEDRTESWQASATTVDITPRYAVPLAGFSDRLQPFNGIRSRLEANILLFRSERGTPVALVALDLLYAGELVDLVGAWASGAGVTVHFAASHTHFGPATDGRLSGLGPLDEGYITTTAAAVCEALERMLQAPPTDGTNVVSSATARLAFAVRRRRRGAKFVRSGRWVRLHHGIVSAPQTQPPADAALHVLRFGTPEKPVAVVWVAGCHPIAAPVRDAVDAEFPGVVRAELRRVDEQLPVLFLQSGGGDVRPSVTAPRGRERLWLELRGFLTGRPPWRQPDLPQWRGWAEQLASAVASAHFAAQPRPLSVTHIAAMATVAGLGRDDGSLVQLEGFTIGLAADLNLVGFNVELMTDHPAAIRRNLRYEGETIVFGYADRVFGYWPTTAMVADGGYEVDQHYGSFGLIGTVLRDPDHALAGLCEALDGRA